MKTGGKPLPADGPGRTSQSVGQPHIAVKGDDRNAAVRKESDVGETEVTPPWIVERERDLIDNERVREGREVDVGGDGFRPAAGVRFSIRCCREPLTPALFDRLKEIDFRVG